MEDFTGLVPDSWLTGLQDAAGLAVQGVQTYNAISGKTGSAATPTTTSAPSAVTAQTTAKSSNTTMWIIGGAVALLALIIGIFALRKP